METNIELSALFSATNVNADSEAIRAALISRLGKEHTANVNVLTYTAALYLFTVYEVESRRAEQLCTIKAIFSYFNSFKDTSSSLYPVMTAILASIFDQFVNKLKQGTRSEVSETILEDHMEFLTVQLCHRFVVLQDLALRYACLLLENSPFLKRNANCLNVLMKCLLTIKINLAPVNCAPVTLASSDLRVLHDDTPLHYELQLPFRSDELQSLYDKVKSVFSIWISSDDIGFEEEILIMIQKYVV